MTREGLLAAILSWYANSLTWKPGNQLSPYSSGASSIATKDAGKIAKAAISADSIGKLILVLCDAYEIPLTALGRRSSISDTRTAEIARGSDITNDESSRLSLAISEMIR